jgi:hypothetical protein
VKTPLFEKILCAMFLSALLFVSCASDSNTGFYISENTIIALHLHAGGYTDTKHPFHTPTFSGFTMSFSGTKQGANDKTAVNLTEYFHKKISVPDCQT